MSIKYIIIAISLVVATSCVTTKQVKVSTEHKLYEKELKDSLNKKDFKRSSYILKHQPDIKTLDYYLLFVKYHKLNKSLKVVDKQIKKEKNPFVVEYLTALRYFVRGVYSFDDSLLHFEKALTLKNYFKYPLSELYYNIAVLKSKKGELEEAFSMIEKAFNIEKREKYYLFKAYLLFEKGEFKEARKLLNNSFDKMSNPKYIGKATKIMLNIEHSFMPIPKKVKEGYQNWLSVVKTGRQTANVLAAAKRGINEFPQFSEMYTLAGLSSFFMDRKGDAVNYFKKAIILNKNITFNYIQLGIIYFNLKVPIDAKTIFEEALAINKYLPVAYSYLSKVEKELGNYEKSLLRKEQELKFGKYLKGYIELIRLYNIKPLKERKKLIEKVIKLYPDEPKPYRMMVALYEDLIEEESNPDIKYKLKKQQQIYNSIYEDKSFEKSKKRLNNKI